MHSALPLLDPVLWLRFLLAATLVVWLPGWLVAGRWLSPLDRLSRFVLSIGVGLILPFVFHALLGRFGVGFTPLAYLLFAAALGTGLGFWPGHRRAVRAWSEGLDALDARTGLLGILATLLLLGGLILGFGDLPVPPHVHDASNHAWITSRIAELGTLDASILDDTPVGAPLVRYLPGVHATAALVARVGDLAPYVSIWMLSLVLCSLIPLAWTLLWRMWQLPAPVLGIAVLLPVANQLGPGGVLGWGGFGQVVGFFIVPVGSLALLAGWRSRAVYPLLLAGFALGGIAFLHASEVLVCLGAVFLIPRRAFSRVTHGELAQPARLGWGLGILLIVAGMMAVCGPEGWPLVADYSRDIDGMGGDTKTLGDALNRLWRSGGRGELQQLLFILGWFFGWRAKPLRRLTVASMALGLFYILLQTLADPVTRLLSKPFYSQATRILYLQFYLLPPLMAWPLVLLFRRLREWRGMRPAAAVTGVSMLWMLVAGLIHGVRSYGNSQVAVPFDRADYEHALAIGETVEEGAWIANLWDDGSTWAMQVSGRNFVHPCAWPILDPELGDLDLLMSGLAEDPWPTATKRLLESHGLEYFYVSDTVWGQRNPLRRADFDHDPRFEAVVVGENSTLYRIKNR
jgi:hypothetical protein